MCRHIHDVTYMDKFAQDIYFVHVQKMQILLPFQNIRESSYAPGQVQKYIRTLDNHSLINCAQEKCAVMTIFPI